MAEWIITCNSKAYNIAGAFEKFDIIEWKQSTNINVGDTVYIYVGVPVRALAYKCEVLKVEQTEIAIDDFEFILDGSRYEDYGRYMRLQLLEKLNNHKLEYKFLKANGLNTVQGPSQITEELSAYILEATASMDDISINKNITTEEAILLSDDPTVIIEKLIAQFLKNIYSIKDKEKKLELLRKKFVDDFYINKLKNMTKEEYVVGLGRKDSFCYRIESELQDLGNIKGSPSAKFGLYYGKKGDNSEKAYRATQSFGENPDEALEEIKKQIIYLLMDGEKKDLEAIRKSKLAKMYRGKILSTFFPEDYLCIFTDEHLDYFIKKLGMIVNSKEDILDKQSKLIEWKNSRIEMSEWNNYLFTSFLYASFGRPLEEYKNGNDEQKEKDKEYPRDYITKIGITIGQWKELITNPDIFKPEDISLLKRFYMAENHATTCYDLGVQDGVDSSSYIFPVVALCKRVSVALNLEPILGDDGKQVWWRILFWGRYREDNRFEWKLRPKLAKAMIIVFPALRTNIELELEEKEDNNLVEELKLANVNVVDTFEYRGEKKEKEVPIYTNGHKIYPRNKQTAINALAHANYECEIDSKHPTFIRKKGDRKYTEPHHFIPMAFTEKFEVSLDVEENIVSLCSNCHNQIHYGKDADVLLQKIYEERKEILEEVGLKIEIRRLLEMYGYDD